MVGNQTYCTWKVSLWLLRDGLFQRHVSNQIMAFPMAGGKEEERRWREGERVRRREEMEKGSEEERRWRKGQKKEKRRAEVKGKGGIICEKESLNTRQSLPLHTLQLSERIASGHFHY